ncbi:MAG: nickel pincer cofactor biosynthesis protein LarC [Pseudomonadota bacterium]
MNTILYIDCFAGISGDMFLSSMVDLGVPKEYLLNELKKLNLPGINIDFEKVLKKRINCTYLINNIKKEKAHRSFLEIKELIQNSALSDFVKEKSVEVFKKLGLAEARIHGTSLEAIHFHEVGALDSILDIIGACICIDYLKIDKIFASKIPLSRGQMTFSHGCFPFPAPATCEILKDVPCYNIDLDFENVTPTGSAILSCFVEKFDHFPEMTLKNTSYGAGTFETKPGQLPNVLRLILGESHENQKIHSEIQIIETNIDDMNPQFFEVVMEKLYEAGALDVYINNIIMKKSRPAFELKIISPIEKVDAISEVLFNETSTIGIRSYKAQRQCLQREIKEVETQWGNVKIKNSIFKNKIVNNSIEYEDLKRISSESGLSIKELSKFIQSKI